MSKLSVDLSWNRKEDKLLPGKFSSEHEVSYNEQYKVLADAAPDWGGSTNNTNPEQALAASLSSCHMMTFLALAAKTKWPVSSYKDHAVARLGKNSKMVVVGDKTQIDLVTKNDSGLLDAENKLRNLNDIGFIYLKKEDVVRHELVRKIINIYENSK